MPHQPGHIGPPSPPPKPPPVYTPPKYKPGKGGISGWAKPITPKLGLGTTKGIWKRRQPQAFGTTTVQTNIPKPATAAEYESAKKALAEQTSKFTQFRYLAKKRYKEWSETLPYYTPIPKKSAPKGVTYWIPKITDVAERQRLGDLMSSYEAWSAKPYKTSVVGADPSPELARRVQARDVRLAARRAASRGEATLYNYLSPQAFRRAMQRRYS